MKVKIELKKGESIEEAKDKLLKALLKAENSTHKEEFKDPVARDALSIMEKRLDTMWAKMLKEIEKELDNSVK